MTAMPHDASSDRKDLQDLRRLPRSPLLSYLKKQMRAPAPRAKAAAFAPAARAKAATIASKIHPILTAFDPRRWWNWIWEYLRHRLGRRHRFLFYSKSD